MRKGVLTCPIRLAGRATKLFRASLDDFQPIYGRRNSEQDGCTTGAGYPNQSRLSVGQSRVVL